jgi:hypothetical protein
MNVYFSQIYVESKACFPFSHFFQKLLSQEVSAVTQVSEKFIKLYGVDYALMFRISAKSLLEKNEILGPTVFRKTKDVEYTIYLPFDLIMKHADVPRVCIQFLLQGIYDVYDRLGLEKSALLAKQDEILEMICCDATMLAAPSWDELQNQTKVRGVFHEFFSRKS